MSHSLKAARWMRSVLAGGLLLPLSVTAVYAAEPAQAMIMPKAGKSLLLDLQRQGNTLVAVGERGHILLSADQGKTWQQAAVPMAQMLTAVYFVDDQHGWAVGHDGNIVNTTDGGQTWALQRDGLADQAVRNEKLLKEARAEVRRLQVLISRGVEEPNDEGMTPEEQLEEAQWAVENAQERLHETTIAPPLMDVWFADNQRGWAVGAFGTFLSTDDGGKTWEDKTDQLTADGMHLNSVTGGRDGLLVVAGEAGYITVSHNYGNTWQQPELDTDSTIFGLMGSADGDLLIATGLRGVTFRSRDHGDTWQELSPQVDYSLANGSLAGDRVVLVGSGGTIAVSEDQGDTFQRYILPSRSSLGQGVMMENGKLLLVGQGGVHRFDINAVIKE